MVAAQAATALRLPLQADGCSRIARARIDRAGRVAATVNQRNDYRLTSRRGAPAVDTFRNCPRRPLSPLRNLRPAEPPCFGYLLRDARVGDVGEGVFLFLDALD